MVPMDSTVGGSRRRLGLWRFWKMVSVPSSVVSEVVAHFQVGNVEVLATREP